MTVIQTPGVPWKQLCGSSLLCLLATAICAASCRSADTEKRLALLEDKIGITPTAAPSAAQPKEPSGKTKSGVTPLKSPPKAAASGGCVKNLEGVASTVDLLRGCPIDRAANLLWNGQPAKHETDKAELNVADT